MKNIVVFSCSGMFRDVPGCSRMFQDVPECSGMFHVPGFIDARPKRSDRERCEVKKAMKSRGGLGREVLTGVTPLTSLAFIFSRCFLLRTAPHYLNAWNRLSS